MVILGKCKYVITQTITSLVHSDLELYVEVIHSIYQQKD